MAIFNKNNNKTLGKIFTTLNRRYPELEIEKFSNTKLSELTEIELNDVIITIMADDKLLYKTIHPHEYFSGFFEWDKRKKAAKLFNYIKNNIL